MFEPLLAHLIWGDGLVGSSFRLDQDTQHAQALGSEVMGLCSNPAGASPDSSSPWRRTKGGAAADAATAWTIPESPAPRAPAEVACLDPSYWGPLSFAADLTSWPCCRYPCDQPLFSRAKVLISTSQASALKPASPGLRSSRRRPPG